jgi:hypothetical protein
MMAIESSEQPSDWVIDDIGRDSAEGVTGRETVGF